MKTKTTPLQFQVQIPAATDFQWLPRDELPGPTVAIAAGCEGWLSCVGASRVAVECIVLACWLCLMKCTPVSGKAHWCRRSYCWIFQLYSRVLKCPQCSSVSSAKELLPNAVISNDCVILVFVMMCHDLSAYWYYWYFSATCTVRQPMAPQSITSALLPLRLQQSSWSQNLKHSVFAQIWFIMVAMSCQLDVMPYLRCLPMSFLGVVFLTEADESMVLLRARPSEFQTSQTWP